MKKIIYLIVVVSMVITTSCSSTYRTMSASHISPVNLAPLTPEQYSISQDIEGVGEASSFLIFGIGSQFRAKDRAMCDAINKIPNADMLISPRFEVSKFSIPLIYSHFTVKVKGKSIQLKTTQSK
jgi:hypothetical protein